MTKKSLRNIAPENPELMKVLHQAHNRLNGVRSQSTTDGKTGEDPGVDYAPKAGDERKWIAAHSVEKHADRVGNINHPYTQPQEKYDLNFSDEKRHGRKRGDDEKVYESKENLQCNMSESGKYCPMHEMADCSTVKNIKETSVEYKQNYVDKATRKLQKNPEEILDPESKSGKRLRIVRDVALNKIPAQKMRPVNEDEELDPNDVRSAIANSGHDPKRLRVLLKKLTKHRPEYVRTKGYTIGEESDISERHLTPKEKSEREEIAQAIARENPNMPMGKKMAIATAQAKKVAEDLAMPLLQGDDDSGADMVKTELRALSNKAMHLTMTMPDGMHVEPWVQAKIAQAKELVSSVHDYMVYGDHDKPEEKEDGTPNEGGWDASGGVPNTYGPAGSGNPFGPQV